MLTYDTLAKCDEKYIGTDGRTEVKQYTPLLRQSGGILKHEYKLLKV